MVTYNEYRSAGAAYIAAVQEVDPSAAKDRRKAQNDYIQSLNDVTGKNEFEQNFYIDLPDE